jgi:RNA polymerase sigma factor (TIGR02999 family)
VDTDASVTQLLQLAGAGDDAARDRLWSLLYSELHRLAEQQMAAEPAGPTLQPTALIHEAYLRLFNAQKLDCENRQHFFALAAKVMRQVRVDAARRRKRLKRGGAAARVELTDRTSVFEEDPLELLTINEALERLGERDPLKARLVELRFFAGLSIDDCAMVLGVSPRTIDNEWRFARAWLHQEVAPLSAVPDSNQSDG